MKLPAILAPSPIDVPDVLLSQDLATQNHARWREVFARRIGPRFDGQLIFEIGCFDADFLGRVATRHPHTGFVGVDWKQRTLVEGADRIRSSGVANAILVKGRAQNISHIFGRHELNELWLFHPEPCDKPRELKNRLFNESFLTDVHDCLCPGGLIALKTDHAGYFQWALALMGLPAPAWRRVHTRELRSIDQLPQRSTSLCERFDVTCASADFANDPDAKAHTSARRFSGEQTGFEKRFANKGWPIYFMELRSRLVSAAPIGAGKT